MKILNKITYIIFFLIVLYSLSIVSKGLTYALRNMETRTVIKTVEKEVEVIRPCRLEDVIVEECTEDCPLVEIEI